MARRLRKTGRKALSKLRGQPVDPSSDVPGPSHDPATNILLADIVMRMGSYVMRRAVEHSFLKGRYGKQTAKDIVRNKGLGQELASVAVARFATGSLPGAAIVGTGLTAKMLLDRSKARRAAKVEGDRKLLEQAKDD